MAGTQEIGVDFVHRIIAELKVIQDDVAKLQRTSSDLQSSLRIEQKDRENDVAKIHDRISQERAAETHMRNVLERRQEDFEGRAKTWVGALGKDCVATKEQLAAFEADVTDRMLRQKAADDLRLSDLERAVPTKSSVADLQRLEAEVSLFRAEAEREHQATHAAIRSAAAAATQDFKMAEDHIDRLQTYLEAMKKSVASELSALTSKHEALDTFAQTRAKAADLQALEAWAHESDRHLERLGQELGGKASQAALSSASERLTHLSMDVQSNEARNQADKESLLSHLGALEKGLEKNSRQLESDRERTSNCIVALEKELHTKASKAETDLIGPSTLRAASEKLENRALDLEKHIAVTRQELVPHRNRIEALEMAFPTKADASEIPRLSLAIADQTAKQEGLAKRAHEHDVRLDKVDSHLNVHATKLESVESSSIALDKKVSTKAEAADHFTKDHTADLFKDFYRREEIDAMLSRVWWRVGDMNKGRLTTTGSMLR